MIRCILVDDEPKSTLVLSHLLKDHFPDLEIVGEANDAASALELIRELDPDLVFLDIELGDTLGFELLDSFLEPFFQVIFVSAYSQYALKAFQYEATDYLMKPVSVENLEKSIHRVRRSLKKELDVNSTLPKEKSYLDLSKGESTEILDMQEILYLEASGSYTRILLRNGKSHVVTSHIGAIEEQAHSKWLIRIHRSYLVNFMAIKRVIKDGHYKVEMDNGEVLEVSRRNKTDFIKKIRHLLRN